MRTICAPYMHQELSKAEDVLLGFEDHGSKEWRQVLLTVISLRAYFGAVLEGKVRREQFDSQTCEEFAESVA